MDGPDAASEVLRMMAPVPVKVECHCGYKGEEYPVAVYLDGRRREVTEILDRWYQGTLDPSCPTAEYFKVRTAQGLLLLKHDQAGQGWFLMSEL